MNRTTIRISSAVLAVIATSSVLKGIAVIAAATPSDRMSLVVLPRVEVVATSPHDRTEQVAAAQS